MENYYVIEELAKYKMRELQQKSNEAWKTIESKPYFQYGAGVKKFFVKKQISNNVCSDCCVCS